MTNLTKPPNNMLMKTNSFMKPASQLQNRPLLRRSITGMGAFLLSNKHEFKKEDNKKNRNKNQSPNNYIISDQFDPSSTKKSKQNNNNDYDEDEDLHKFDLYRSSPTLFYIKEKYKMYLEWLNEKSSKENHQQLMNSSTDITPQLNWYNYEKIVYLNETSCLDYLKYIQSSSNSSSSSSSSPESITIESNIQRKESIPIPSINRMSSSSMSFNNNNKQLINKNKNKVRSISQQEMTCNNSKSSNVIPKQCSDTILITNLKSNTNNNTSLKNLLNKLSNNNNENSIFESSQKLTKEVKFDQSFSITNSTITTTTSNNNNNNNNTNPISILKPILKTSSIMNNSTNEYYFNNNLKTISPREQLRRVSVLTINNNNNNNTTASKSLSNLKLPPILNASDDFQAVMNDLLSSNE